MTEWTKERREWERDFTLGVFFASAVSAAVLAVLLLMPAPTKSDADTSLIEHCLQSKGFPELHENGNYARCER